MRLWGLVVAAVSSVLVLACSSSSSSPVLPYGGGGGGGGGGGAGGGAGGHGAGGGGGNPVDGGGGQDSAGSDPCADGGPVSWAADIYPQILGSGHWQCTSGGCHSAGSASNPIIDATSAGSAYRSCLSAQLLNPSNTTDPERSQLYALLSSGAMPLTSQGAQDATPAELSTLATWIGCGSPDN